MSLDLASTPSLSESVARYWAGCRLEQLPPDVVTLSKKFLLDTVAAGIAGAGTELADQVVSGTARAAAGAAGRCGIWGRGEVFSPAHAALINGTLCHIHELDDYGGCGHPGAVVIPAVFAAAVDTKVDGATALTAIAAGYDLSARVVEGAGGYRPHTRAGWHATGTCGSFAAAGAAAVALGLDEEKFTAALGIAGSFTGGIWAFLKDGSMTKRVHCGKAAETGIVAALLADSGITGPRYVLDAEWGGFFTTYARDTAQPARTTEGLGEDFGIRRAGMKPYPCCRDMHNAIDGLIEIMTETGAAVTDIARIIVHGDAQTERQFSNRVIETNVDAQFSFPYALAVAAVSGGAGLKAYFPLRHREPAVLDAMALVVIVPDVNLEMGEYPWVQVDFNDGGQVVKPVRYAKGAPENPLSEAELSLKVQELITPVLGDERCARIVECIGDLENIGDLNDLAMLLCRQPAKVVKH